MNNIDYAENNLQKCRLSVDGVDCPDCAVKVEKAVSRIPGVVGARLAFPAGNLNVELDSSITGIEQIIEKVGKLGYQARSAQSPGGEGRPFDSRILLKGLDCIDCGVRIERRILKVPGVESVNINFGASRLKIRHTGSVEEILDVLGRMGYSAALESPSNRKEKPLPLWKTNMYALPCIVSLVSLIAGLLVINSGAPGILGHGLMVAGIILGGYIPARNGLRMLANAREMDMNVLMSIAVIGAVALGQYEEAAAVVFLFSLGNFLQAYTLDKTRNSIRSLMDLGSPYALVRRGDITIMAPVEELEIGDIITVRPGEKIPMDGEVVAGYSTVNQAPITGESVPVTKETGHLVYAGTINGHGSIDVLVTGSAAENTLNRIVKMVEEAEAQKAPSQMLIDRFAKYYTPAVLAAAVLVAVVPPLVGSGNWGKWVYQALGMLLVACPCALVISTPVSIVAAIGSAARSGVLIKGGSYLEEAGSLSVIAFDKTGTLSTGSLEVTDIIPLNGTDERELLTIAASIENRSEHPFAAAILRRAYKDHIMLQQVADFRAVPGKGATARIEGRSYVLGSMRLIDEAGHLNDALEAMARNLETNGKTVVLVVCDGVPYGILAAADAIRPNSKKAIDGLKKVGIKKTIMLTGDNETIAGIMAARAGVDEYRSGLLPDGKLEAISELKQMYGKVAMVGDGINDAPALAAATVGIAMGTGGTDAALETADIALVSDDLQKLEYTVRLSRQTTRIIKQNIWMALLIKSAILLLVIPGWLTLWLAVVGDMGSSLLVTANGMRLLRLKHIG